MPYINEKRRREILTEFSTPKNAGELNYLITTNLITYMYEKGESYQTYNDIIGALEGVKLELYARKIRPYEDEKIKDNGDVYI